MIILSLLGISVYDVKSIYKNHTKFLLIEGEYINSIDVLLQNYEDEKFIFLGTKESIETHKDTFGNLLKEKNYEFKDYDSDNLNDIFMKIMKVLIDNKDEKILFDITHSFRDSVIMSVISTIVSQIIFKPNLSMIYAKQGNEKKTYTYELVSEDILNTSNIAFILSTFLSTLKVPPLYSKYELYDMLDEFSTHLISNQFRSIYNIDLERLKNYIYNNRDRLFAIKPLLKKFEELLESIEVTKNKEVYEQFLFFADFFTDKDYYVNASAYLIESITYYLGYSFKKLGYINFDLEQYENQQKIVGLLKLSYKKNDFNFPNDYFVDINIDTINRFSTLRESIAKIRHNLAHINIHQDYSKIKEILKEYIEEFNNLIKNRLIEQLDISEEKKIYTVKYKIKMLEQEMKYCLISLNASSAKLTTIVDKYRNSKLDNLTNYNHEKLKRYLENNISRIDTLLENKKNRKLIEVKKELIQEPKSNPVKKATKPLLKPIKIVKKASK